MKEGVERLDLTNIIPVRSYLLYIAVRPFEFTSTETATCNAILENTEDEILPLEATWTSLRCKGISISWRGKPIKIQRTLALLIIAPCFLWEYHIQLPESPLPTSSRAVPLCQLKRICLQVLFKSRESASSILSSPSNQLFRIWAPVAELFQVAESFRDDILREW